MENKNDVIRREVLLHEFWLLPGHVRKAEMDLIRRAPSVNVVELAQIEAVKQEILARMDEFYNEYRRISESDADHFAGKADAMDVARRLVNAAFNDLCHNSGVINDGCQSITSAPSEKGENNGC